MNGFLHAETPHEFFEQVYQDETLFAGAPPWEIGEPQPALVDLENHGHIAGDVLDIGCGTGENALFLASRGHAVTGIDISETAIEAARTKAKTRGIAAQFVVDGSFGADYRDRFGTVVDCGLFHGIDPELRTRYRDALQQACAPGASLYVLAISARSSEWVQSTLRETGISSHFMDHFPSTSPDDFRTHFADGWTVEAVDESSLKAYFAGSAEPTILSAWLAHIRRT